MIERASPDVGAMDDRESSETELFDAEAQLVADKWRVCWGSQFDARGAANVYAASRMLYHALYDQEHAAELLERPNPKFPDQVPTLEAPLLRQPQHMPDEDKFITRMRDVMSREVDFRRCVYEGSEEQMKELMRRGHVVIWSSGDAGGYEDAGLPGSAQQVKKMAFSGMGQWRRDIARERGAEKYGDVLSLAVTEHKEPQLDSVLGALEKRGVADVAILEDRLGNLVKAADKVREHGLNPVPIWVRQDKHRNKVPRDSEMSLEEWAEKYNAVNNIADVTVRLQQLGYPRDGVEFGSVVDYDGVLSDATMVDEATIEAVFVALKKEEWL